MLHGGSGEVGVETFIQSGHSETVLMINATGADPVGAVHRKGAKTTGRKRKLIPMEAPLHNSVPAHFCIDMAKDLLSGMKIGISGQL